MNLNAVEPKNFGVKITTTNVETGINQSRRERPFARGYVQQWAAGKIRKNVHHCFVNRFVRQRRGIPHIGSIAQR